MVAEFARASAARAPEEPALGFSLAAAAPEIRREDSSFLRHVAPRAGAEEVARQADGLARGHGSRRRDRFCRRPLRGPLSRLSGGWRPLLPGCRFLLRPLALALHAARIAGVSVLERLDLVPPRLRRRPASRRFFG